MAGLFIGRRAPGLMNLHNASAAALACALMWSAGASAQDATQDSTATNTPAQAALPAEPQAQPATPRSPAQAAAAQEIIVTGSRLARSTFDTPTPVTVVGAADFQKLAITNVGQGLNELPAFRPSTTPVTQGFGSFNVGANIVNLRGLGVTRNLILVDGRRFAPTTREGSVDLNLIPSILIARTEVVTGGASAQYGSDAIAGVVNIILDKSLQGIKLQLDNGISSRGDGYDVHAGAAYGTAFANGAGHFIIGGEYDNQKGIGNCFTRSWCKTGAVVTNPGYKTNGLPNYVRSNDNAGWFFNPSGVVSTINNASGRGNTIARLSGVGAPAPSAITFDANGNPVPYGAGSPAAGLSQVGGNDYATYTDANITVPVQRYTGFAHVDYDFNDAISAFAEGSYGHVAGQLLQTAYFSSSIPIYADNAYLPAALRPYVGAAGPVAVRPTAAAFNLGRVLDDVGRGYSVSTADTYRGTAGLNGKFANGWSWDGYYQYGRTDRTQTVANNLVVGDPTQPVTSATSNARFFWAADAVRNPANGNIVCRATLSPDPALRQAAAGCVPIDLFGAGNVSQAGANYIFNTLVENIRLQQHVLAGNLRGDLAQLWAGPLSFAIGGEYRIDKINVTHDPLSNQYAYFQNFGSDYHATSKVAEGYLEAGLPLVKDASWTKSLSLDGAARVTHYDINGFGSYLRTQSTNKFTRVTWKVSAEWEPVSGIRVRATQSHDIRAPNFADLYLASASSFTPVLNPFTGVTQTPSIVNGGSPNLKPEAANTTTAGIVLSPHGGFFGRARLSVDYYHIRVNDYIAPAPGGVQQIANQCFAGVAQACGLISFGAGQSFTQIRNISLNLDRLVTTGVDIESEYRVPLGDEQSITLRALATYVSKLEAVSLGQSIDRAGQTGSSAALASPDWSVNGYVSYDSPHVSFTVQGRYITPGLYDASYTGPGQSGYSTSSINSISDNKVPGRFYVNLSGSFHVGPDKERGFELFGAINNLFNVDPPAAPETQFYTNPVYFDTIGRYYRAGVRYRF